MNLFQPFRSEVERLGSGLSDTLDFITAKINAIWKVEHNDDGTHADVTASSITSTGAGTFNGNVTADADGTPVKIGAFPIEGSIRPIAGVDCYGSATNHWRIGAYPQSGGALKRELLFADVAAALGPYTIRVVYDVVNSVYAIAGDAASPIQLGRDATGERIDAIYVRQGIFDGGAAAYGAWVADGFSAGDYTSSTGTWTLAAGDMTLRRSMRINKTLTMAFVLDTTSVSGGQAQLRITIPGGFIAAQSAFLGAFTYNDNGAGFVTGGTMFVVAGQSYLGLQLGTLGVSTWAASVNNTAVYGTATFEVQ